MRCFKRDTDGTVINDSKDRDVGYINETYGGGFVEVTETQLSADAEQEQTRTVRLQKSSLLDRMKKLEGDIFYSTLTGDIDPESGRPWAEVKKDAWLVLRQQLLNLGV